MEEDERKMMRLDIQLFGGRGASSSNSARTLNRKIVNTINNGQVFDFSVGPTMTLISRYENGDYTWLNSSGDSPMRAFETEVVPNLKDEFIVIDDGISKVSRASRFKKYGYEVAGEITETEKDIMNGIYTNKPRGTAYDKKWILMRKKK